MTYRRVTWLPKVLRKAGLNVICEPGWRKRGLGAYRPFDPHYLVWHHDASEKGPSPGVVDYMLSRFSVAAAQVWVCMGCDGKHPIGTWHILASGRAPHTGAVLPGMPDNENSIGIETDHTTHEHWHPDLLTSLRTGSAAIFVHLKQSAREGLHFHKTICAPPGRKTDPAALHLDVERVRVAAAMAPPRPKVRLQKLQKAARHPHTPYAPLYTRRVQGELRAAGVLRHAVPGVFDKRTRRAYAAWQRHLGYHGKDANGIPGWLTLRSLGRRRHGFRAVR